MSDTICSKPKCQTTAGCQCGKSDWMMETIADALRHAYERGLEDAAKLADEWSNTGTMLLRAGEMTAQEKRTAKSIVLAIAAAIRALKEVLE
jgi:hypothetical protein